MKLLLRSAVSELDEKGSFFHFTAKITNKNRFDTDDRENRPCVHKKRFLKISYSLKNLHNIKLLTKS